MPASTSSFDRPETRARRTARETGRLVAVLGLVLVVIAVAAVLAFGPRPEDAVDPVTSGPAGGPVTVPAGGLTATAAGRAFLAGYVEPSGRVVRRDQGGDTVSEGQAYALLVSAALGDRTAFTRVWDWTRAELLRPDGTLSWRWQRGQVVDSASAADADLDAAQALIIAGATFRDHRLTAAGVALGAAVLDTESARSRLGRVLLPGGWARTPDVDGNISYNPSYASPAAFRLLGRASGDGRWDELATGSRAATTAVLAGGLPSDWATIRADGTVVPAAGPTGRGGPTVRYGYDATRLPIRYAESCDPADVILAARLAPTLIAVRTGTAELSLTGATRTTDLAPVAAAARAAAETSSGHRDRAAGTLLQADRIQSRTPTYYGAAWDALGRLMLQTDSLGGCAAPR